MRLADAAKHFDTTPAYDAYTAALQFSGQIDAYDGWVRDTMIGGRRSISTDPAVVIPARRAVQVAGKIYLVGDYMPEAYNGKEIRHHHILQPAPLLATIRSAAQVLAGAGGSQAYAQRAWRKDRKEESVTSELYNEMNLYLASTETVARDQVIEAGGRLHRVQNVTPSQGGFLIAEAAELEADAIQAVVYTPQSTSRFNPATDSYGEGAPANFNVLYEHYQTNYRFRTGASDKFEPGDLIVTASKTDLAAPNTGDKLVLASVEYWVKEYQDDQAGSWELWVRRV